MGGPHDWRHGDHGELVQACLTWLAWLACGIRKITGLQNDSCTSSTSRARAPAHVLCGWLPRPETPTPALATHPHPCAQVLADLSLRVVGWRQREPATSLEALSAATDVGTDKQHYVEMGKGGDNMGASEATPAQAGHGKGGRLGEPLVGAGGAGNGGSSTAVAEALVRSRPSMAAASVASVAEA